MDILLTQDGDLFLNDNGDIVITNSVSQQIKIKLQWFLGEWRWDKEKGLPYFEELFIKNPDTDYFEGLIREQIFSVDEVTEVVSVSIDVDTINRVGTIKFIARTDKEIIREEVHIFG